MQQTYVFEEGDFLASYEFEIQFFSVFLSNVIFVFNWETRQTYFKNETAAERENGSRKKRKEQEVELRSKKRLFMNSFVKFQNIYN